MLPRVGSAREICLAVILTSAALVSAVSSQKSLQPLRKASYAPGQAISITCLNRTIDNGEHIQDDRGRLQYIPFPTCNETGKPLELYFGVETDALNCTIPFISDEFFHLLEYYVHNDAPMTCRVPARPLTGGERDISGSPSSSNDEYIPLVFSLSGALELSHLHISNQLNVLLHAAPRSVAPGVIDSATAYSVSPNARTHRTIIGDPLPLRLSVRWYPTASLPSGWGGVGGHVFLSTLAYCVLSAGATAAACLAYFRGVELPRKLRRYGAERVGGDGHVARTLGGYGYPSGNGHSLGFGGSGKLD